MFHQPNAHYELDVIIPPDSKNRAENWNSLILESITAKTAAVAIGNVHWADGTFFDLKAIRDRTNKYDAALIIDGTQSVGALPLDIDDLKPDAVICAGYKWLMGPYSIGLAYYGEMFDNGQPIENNWINRKGAEDFGGLINYVPEYMNGSLRYEIGEHSNFILLPMLIAAIKQILKWTPHSIQEYCKNLTREPLLRLKDLGYWIEQEDWRSSHLFGIRIPGNIEMNNVQKQLKINRVNVSTRGNAIRVSPNVYNDQKDLFKLVRALEAAKN